MLANLALQQTGLSVASLPLAPAAERTLGGRNSDRRPVVHECDDHDPSGSICLAPSVGLHFGGGFADADGVHRDGEPPVLAALGTHRNARFTHGMGHSSVVSRPRIRDLDRHSHRRHSARHVARRQRASQFPGDARVYIRRGCRALVGPAWRADRRISPPATYLKHVPQAVMAVGWVASWPARGFVTIENVLRRRPTRACSRRGSRFARPAQLKPDTLGGPESSGA
jgi:hypothetical protein